MMQAYIDAASEKLEREDIDWQSGENKLKLMKDLALMYVEGGNLHQLVTDVLDVAGRPGLGRLEIPLARERF